MDDLGNRMKGYENVSRIYLTKRTPVIIRIDGKAFHTFTKGFEKPFDEVLLGSMQDTCKFLCENVMNCRVAYTQSDEISLLLTDYATLTTQPWFENNPQKLVSISASMATLAFNNAFSMQALLRGSSGEATDEQLAAYFAKSHTAMFDARAFILPKEEVCNYFVWRQQDAVRNSVQMLAQSMFSHKELHGKSNHLLQDMMHEKGVNWADLPRTKKHGCCIVKAEYDHEGTKRTRWAVDNDTPIFMQDREYIEKYI